MCLFRWMQCKLWPTSIKYLIRSVCSVTENCWNVNSSCCRSLWEEADVRPTVVCGLIVAQMISLWNGKLMFLSAYTETLMVPSVKLRGKKKQVHYVYSIHSYTHSFIYSFYSLICNNFLKQNWKKHNISSWVSYPRSTNK